MTERTLFIQPRDPAIFRDGKPFTQGLPARSVDWPLPSAIIGAIRTRLGRNTGYRADAVNRLLHIEHFGPFLAARGPQGLALAFPAPADAVAFEARKTPQGRRQLELCPLRPARLKAGEGVDLPREPEDLHPLLGGRDQKPTGSPPFWSASATLDWLKDPDSSPRFSAVEGLGFSALPRQRRIHLEIESATQAARKGALFATEGLEFSDRVRIAEEDSERWEDLEPKICSRIRYQEGEDWPAFESLAPLGGERRMANWSETGVDWPGPPDWLAGQTLVRLQLITPGYFDAGWIPNWLLNGHPPGIDDMQLKLIAAAVPRAVAHSGWDFTKKGANSQKATRFLAPAGSVYFCELKGDPRRLWMRSICDNPQAGRDGFGLVLCGVWQWR